MLQKKEFFKADTKDILLLCAITLGVLFILWTFTGLWPWAYQPYNSYVLQAQSWLDGRLDLPQNYSHLEIAIYNNKYYISFPPFPSYLMLPLVLLGLDSFDGMWAVAFALAGVVYAYKIFRHLDIEGKRSMLYSLLLTIGSNWVLVAQSSWVWFIAQNIAFALSLMAIYYALNGKGCLSLTFWACAVGSRPFQALYLPVLLYLLYGAYKKDGMTFKEMLKRKWVTTIPMLIIAISYRALNYARFGNPIEFGHNYLPEFAEAELGQFNWAYIPQNLVNLFRLPGISFTKKWDYPIFNGMNIFMISPIFISYVICIIYALKDKLPSRKVLLLAGITVVIQLLLITAHKTMGGYQFGNRYTIDVLPLIFLCMAMALPNNSSFDNANKIFLMCGMTLNVIGSVLCYIG